MRYIHLKIVGQDMNFSIPHTMCVSYLFKLKRFRTAMTLKIARERWKKSLNTLPKEDMELGIKVNFCLLEDLREDSPSGV